MTDLIEILRATPVISEYGETTYTFADATVVATGYGSIQLYISAEYDVDRDTYSRIGRLISDDVNLYGVQPKDWIRQPDGTLYEADGIAQKWNLRGRHHIEQGVKIING